uniref:Uncharacterized protein n=1 Tax=Heterorhabditis bacteriophora TaxID=37862 RepID=A0A1I7WLZ2_HETBA
MTLNWLSSIVKGRSRLCYEIFETNVELYGTTIKFIVNALKVKRSKMFGKTDEKKRVFDYLANEMNKHLIDFIENLTDLHGDNVQAVLPSQVSRQMLRSVSCTFLHRRVNCSMLGLTKSWCTIITISLYKIEKKLLDYFYFPYLIFIYSNLMPPSRPTISIPQPTQAPSLSIPRNTSVTGLVVQAFETTEQQRSQAKGKRRSYYSRHLLDTVPASPTPLSLDRPDFENAADASYLITFPYSKAQRQSLATGIRQFSKSLRDSNRHSLQLSPVRSTSVRQSCDAQLSAPRATDPPRRTSPPDTLPFRFIIQDEESPRISKKIENRSRNERTVTSGHKTFTVGGEEMRELLPIKEEDKDNH